MNEQEDTGEIDMTIEVETVVEDVVKETTTTSIDVAGDGVAELIQTETVTGVDVDGDGEFSDDEIEVEGEVAVREDLIDEAEAAE